MPGKPFQRNACDAVMELTDIQKGRASSQGCAPFFQDGSLALLVERCFEGR
ncbi:MAG: hypothetical protein ACE5JX_12070 [Acidobacteriota bacterium]